MTPNDLERDFLKVAVESKYDKLVAYHKIEQIMASHVDTLKDFVFAQWEKFEKTIKWEENL